MPVSNASAATPIQAYDRKKFAAMEFAAMEEVIFLPPASSGQLAEPQDYG